MPITQLINATAFHLGLAPESIHLTVCSPPYWNLREYAGQQIDIIGGNSNCQHKWFPNPELGELCRICGAWRGAFGQERLHDCQSWAMGGGPCNACYVCHMRLIGNEIWRVLRPDGTWWLNLGDCFIGSGGAGGDYNEGGLREGQPRYSGRDVVGFLKPKDLAGIPWRVALALQADGWWLRAAPPWIKPNSMPEPGIDRPVISNDYWFLLTKSRHYFADPTAAIQPFSDGRKGASGGRKVGRVRNVGGRRDGFATLAGWNNPNGNEGRGWRTSDFFIASIDEAIRVAETQIRNLKEARKGRAILADGSTPLGLMFSVGHYKGAHFASYNPAMIDEIIRFSTSEHGVCPKCGAPWERVIEKIVELQKDVSPERGVIGAEGNKPFKKFSGYPRSTTKTITTGWQPTCECRDNHPIPAIVLDPFVGAGSTMLSARRLGRDSIGFDISLEYLLENAHPRLSLDTLATWEEGDAIQTGLENTWGELPLFEGLE